MQKLNTHTRQHQIMRSAKYLESVARFKTSIRKEIIRKRQKHCNAKRDEKSLSIARRLFELDEFNKSKAILCFLSLSDEVQTDMIIKESFRLGKEVFVPLVNKKLRGLEVARIPSLDIEFVVGEFGVREPSLNYQEIVSFSCVDFVITPGLAFDICGNRIGYGGGYYDKLFENLPRDATRVGVGYDFQVLNTLPYADFDKPVQFVITETKIFNILDFIKH